jgi:hypothetical protein
MIDIFLWYAITTTFVIAVFILIFIIKNLYAKNNIYENWILDIKNEIIKTKEQIDEVDSKKLFENDDDVGVVFSSIHDLISDLEKKINEE